MEYIELFFSLIATLGTVIAIIVSIITIKKTDRNFNYNVRRELYSKRLDLLYKFRKFNMFKFELFEKVNSILSGETDEDIDVFLKQHIKSYQNQYRNIKNFMDKNLGLFNVVIDQYINAQIRFYEECLDGSLDLDENIYLGYKYPTYIITVYYFDFYMRMILDLSNEKNTPYKKMMKYCRIIAAITTRLGQYEQELMELELIKSQQEKRCIQYKTNSIERRMKVLERRLSKFYDKLYVLTNSDSTEFDVLKKLSI